MRAEQNLSIFCNTKCYGAWRKAECLKQIKLECCYCAAKLEGNHNQRSRLKHGHKAFCGAPCRIAWQRLPEQRARAEQQKSKKTDWDGIFRKFADPHYYDGGRFEKQWRAQVA